MEPIIEIDVELVNVFVTCFVRFTCICMAVFFMFRIISKRAAVSPLPGVWVFAILLVSTSIYDLMNFVDYKYHRLIFAQLSDSIFTLRYFFSICMRLALIVTGVGLVLMKNWARHLAIYFGVFTIATIMWKHPYYVFENIAIMLEQKQSVAPITDLRYPAYPWITMLFYVVIDLVFAGLLIVYLMLGIVAKQFKNDLKNQPTSSAA